MATTATENLQISELLLLPNKEDYNLVLVGTRCKENGTRKFFSLMLKYM